MNTLRLQGQVAALLWLAEISASVAQASKPEAVPSRAELFRLAMMAEQGRMESLAAAERGEAA